MTTPKLRVTDNDKDEITVTRDGQEIRGWSYKNDLERRAKMLCAREYVEGWYDGRIHRIDEQLKLLDSAKEAR